MSPVCGIPEGSPEAFNGASLFKTPRSTDLVGGDFTSIGSPASTEVPTMESKLNEHRIHDKVNGSSVVTVRPRATFAGNRSLSFG